LIVVVTTPQPELPVGTRLVVLGNTLETAATRIGFLGTPTGRPADPVERVTRREGRAGGVRHSWPADVREQARRLRAEGLTYAEVADRLGGVPFGTVKMWLRGNRQAAAV
jgi:hypothetical protein